MTECWSQGELRAYLDRELPPDELGRLTAHLEECAECTRVLQELEARARMVAELLDDLPAVASAQPARPQHHLAPWAVAAAALAAGLAIAWVMNQPRTVPPAPQPRAALQRAVPAPAPPVEAAIAPQPEPVPVRHPLERRRLPRRAATDDGFVALSDEPFETGVVYRMALGPQQVPADVVFGSDGRARAIRLVHEKGN
jgi:hypothetical protein